MEGAESLGIIRAVNILELLIFICTAYVVMSPLSFLVLFVCVYLFFYLASLVRGLSSIGLLVSLILFFPLFWI